MSTEMGSRIKALREKKNYTQAEVGKDFGVTDKSVSFWEKKGVRDKKLIQRIATYFGVSLDFLKNGTPPEVKQDFRGLEQNSGTVTTFKESLPGGNKSHVNSVTSEFPQNGNSHEGRLTAHQLKDYTLLPFIPVSARASFVDRYPDMDYEEISHFPVYNLDPALKKKGAVVIEVNGDSMEPQLKHKAKVLGVPIDKGDWDYMSGIYAIVYAQQFTIKRIIENTLSREGGEIILKADNGGATVAVPGKAIVSVWKIVRMVDAEIS